MALANWLDDFLKDFTHYVADTFFEILVFLGRGSVFNRLDKVIHLIVDAEEALKNLLCYLYVFKQGFLLSPTSPNSLRT